jgi:shikimate dehydrogenase
VAADLVYGRDEGAFLAAARTHGLRVFPGIWMLIGQAALAFELWTGKRFSIEQAHEWLCSVRDHRVTQ